MAEIVLDRPRVLAGDDMQPPLVFSRDEAHIAKMLNNTVNNPIVLVLALAVVVLAFGIYLVAF